MYQIKSYTEGKSINFVVNALNDNENAQVIAGGTDILIKAREGKKGYVDRDLIGITRIPELVGVKLEINGDVLIGPATAFSDVEKDQVVLAKFPILSTAVGTVGGPQVRNVGTVGGNVCNGATSADSASSLFVLDAIMCVEGVEGKREIPIKDFYISIGQVDLKKSEILTGIKIKKECYEGYRGHYIKFSQRKAMDIATLGCAVMIKMTGDVIDDLKIAFGVAGPVPVRAEEAEKYGVGKKLTEDVLNEIGKLCLKNANARDSWRASKAFRERLIEELPQRAILTAVGGR